LILLERRELLDAFRKGDKSSLPAVYRHYVRDVAAFLTRGFTFSSSGKPCTFRGFAGGYEIEAAIQEIFRRAFEERARLAYNGLDPYRPYLLRIARNTIINDLKSKQPILFRFRAGAPVILDSAPTDPDQFVASSAPSAEDLLELEEVARLVERFRAALDERSRGVFRFRFEQGLSAEAVARELGLSRSQVRTTEAKLRKRFLEHMQGSGYLTGYPGKRAGLASDKLTSVFLVAWGLG
jgi:RNA polymerase sigma-70 factor (ECF subfamily)